MVEYSQEEKSKTLSLFKAEVGKKTRKTGFKMLLITA